MNANAIRTFWRVIALLWIGTSCATAATISLFERGVNVDGDLTPSGVNAAGFDETTGLGAIVVTVASPGAHQVLAYFDHEIDESINTFFNELGGTSGAPAAGQSWEIDEPGFVFGDIFDNFVAGTLDNTNGIATPDDVSMAMGWSLILAADETATMTFLVSTMQPGGFYLSHFDPDSDATIYLSSTLRIGGGGDRVSEPGALLLFAFGTLVVGLYRRA